MSSFHMFGVLVCAVWLATTDVALGRYNFRPEINGWLRLHKVAATWDEASRQCKAEGAVLMSPVRQELLDAMLSLCAFDTAYFIGTKASKQPGLYVSLEGVPVADMPVTNMFSQLDSHLGDCLSMDWEHIQVVSCAAQLPYMCYREHVTESGTSDAGVALSRYSFRPKINGWLSLHKVAATWDEASRQCKAEGAVLMSPVRQELLDAMLSLSKDDTAYFIGTKASIQPGLYVSLEGVPVADMPVTNMFSQLDPHLGDCLSMDRQQIRVVSCAARLPYVCYSKDRAGQHVTLTECGTFDTGYKLENSTGSCYKYHTEVSRWPDAYATCIAEGGYLAVVNDEAEAQMLVKISYNKGAVVWVGLRDWDGNGTWTSVRGESLQKIYNKWINDTVPANSCCEIGCIYPTTGQLRSYDDSGAAPFICEKDPNYVTFPFEE